MFQKSFILKGIFSLCILAAVVLIAAVFGTADITVSDFLKVLASKVPFLGEGLTVQKGHEVIIFNLRLPRIILALFAGIGLAVAGTVFQGVFSNPMAEPYLLGVSSGAAFGATVATVLTVQINFLSFGTLSIFAFTGALAVVLLVYKMATSKGKLPVTVLLLSGLAVNYFLSAMITLIMTFNHEELQAVYFWTHGSFKNASWEKVLVVGIVVILCSTYLYIHNRELDLIMLGDEQARTLGVSVTSVKKKLLLISSLMAAIIVAASGIIGFVGLIVPHGVRLITGPTHKKLMPMASVGGGVLLILCDTVARSVLENKEVSVGIITSLLGVPFFLWLLYSNRKAVS